MSIDTYNLQRLFKVFYWLCLRKKGIKTSLQIDVTSKCNLKCLFCAAVSWRNNRPNTSFEYWKKLFEKYKQKPIYNIWLYGGEPLLDLRVVDLASKMFPLVSIITNGTIHLPRKYKCRLFVSLDGLEKTNDKIRGNGVFKKVIKNYAGDKRVVFIYTITKPNISEIAAFIDFAKRVRVGGVVFQFINHSPCKELNLSPTDIGQATHIINTYKNDSFVLINASVLKSMAQGISNRKDCAIRKYLDCFSSNGQARECCITDTQCCDCRFSMVHFHQALVKKFNFDTFFKMLRLV